MKKVVTLGLLLVFVLTGCTGQEQDVSKENENNNTTRGYGIPDFERPEEKSDISGLVKTIIGNEITVLKIERTGVNREEAVDGEENEEKVSSGTGTGAGMGMGSGMSRVDTGTVDPNDRLDMLKSLSVGEEKIIIPVGIKMLKNEDGEIVEATLSDISKDKMLVIWIDKSVPDKNIANFVVIN